MLRRLGPSPRGRARVNAPARPSNRPIGARTPPDRTPLSEEGIRVKSDSIPQRLIVVVAKTADRHGACQGTGSVVPTVPDTLPGMPAGALRSGDPTPCQGCGGTGYL